ncbi:MAG: hypothetical protein A2Y62_09635 [Candidatus Fischerbacteria bacterium RBG_13_37_8]|uniref:Uncharacterized protein n=1 Tax=Candidatus Fischerbacteria bacterium RBG_13_37_8 TaxID=1817863 RepID=A0A1F5V768_9BACT|nr:MAG: hypothetical protein A2Y62_09635 [Candidatus Fischerbacteria bacterium RBG_13_37_8]
MKRIFFPFLLMNTLISIFFSFAFAQQQTNELWNKALEIFKANEKWVPGTMMQKTELLNKKGKVESIEEMLIKLQPDEKEKLKSEIVKVIRDGKDITAEVKEKQQKAEEKRAQDKKEKDSSASFNSDETPFNPDLQNKVKYSLRKDTQTIGGRLCAGFDYTFDMEYTENGKKKTVQSKGMAWLNSETGHPMKLEYTLQPLPSRMKSLWMIFLYEVTLDGKLYAKEMRMEGEGGILFIKKKIRSITTFSDYWWGENLTDDK